MNSRHAYYKKVPNELNLNMSLGTLFGDQQIRTVPPKALIKHFNLDVKIVGSDDAAYQKAFPLKKIPAFVGPKGFKLHEVIAISIYRMY